MLEMQWMEVDPFPIGNPDQMTILQDGSTNGPGSIATNRDSATGQIMHSTIDRMD